MTIDITVTVQQENDIIETCAKIATQMNEYGYVVKSHRVSQKYWFWGRYKVGMRFEPKENTPAS